MRIRRCRIHRRSSDVYFLSLECQAFYHRWLNQRRYEGWQTDPDKSTNARRMHYLLLGQSFTRSKSTLCPPQRNALSVELWDDDSGHFLTRLPCHFRFSFMFSCLSVHSESIWVCVVMHVEPKSARLNVTSKGWGCCCRRTLLEIHEKLCTKEEDVTPLIHDNARAINQHCQLSTTIQNFLILLLWHTLCMNTNSNLLLIHRKLLIKFHRVKEYLQECSFTISIVLG